MLTGLVAFLAFTWPAQGPGASAPVVVLPVAPALVRGVRRAFHGLALRPGDIGRLVALLADHHVELDDLPIADAPHGFFWVVLDDGRLKMFDNNV